MRRRTFLQGVAASSAAASVAGDAIAETQPPAVAEATSTSVTWPLFEPLGAGSEVGLGWRLHTLSEVRRGAMVLTLRHEGGRTAQVHLCRRGHQARGVAHTEELDLVLMNDGDGAVQTDEGLGRVIITLARLIAKNEQRRPGGLMAHAQRLSAHGPRGILE